MTRIPNTDLDVFPMCLGGNVFGWTADKDTSFAVLDAFVAAGGNFIDTADVYSSFAPGNVGGESETILGEWMRLRGNRDQIVIATKVGLLDGFSGLSRDTIHRAVDASLARLQTDSIDLYYAHKDDPETPLGETMGAFDELVRAGKVRHLGASNYSAARLSAAMELGGFAVLQTHYNLVERAAYEDALAGVVERTGLGVVPYYALASGFLTGKYRGTSDDAESVRKGRASRYLDERGHRVLRALDHVSAAHDCEPATVAMAWLASRPGVVAPLASARVPEQVGPLMASASLELSADELALLDTASA